MDPVRIYGSSQKPQEPTILSAGPFTLMFENGDLRYVRLGEHEVIRRVYVAVRDHNWRTIEGKLANLSLDRTESGFEIRYDMMHCDGGIDFAWSAKITGEPAGKIRFEMSGRARKPFRTNRTGFCVLHPIAPCAGRACTIEHADGAVEEGVFPKAISPHQPFKDIRAIRNRVGDAEVRVLMEGEVFEMEDQRNWSDGSYKTYCRPLGLPYPYELAAGQEVQQIITIDLLGEGTVSQVSGKSAAASAMEIDLNRTTGGEWVPQIGLAAGEGLAKLSAASIAAIKSLTPRHLRVDVDLGQAGWDQKLQADLPALKAIGVPVEVAVVASDGLEPLRQLASLWPQTGLTAARWLILPRRGVTTPQQLEAARTELGSLDLKALFGGGTDVEFVAVNRQHPPKGMDVLCFSLNPQVHAFDNLSLVENLESHGDVVASAIAVGGDCPVAVTPISLRRRSNPDATGPDTLAAADRLPANVDVRQVTLFAAAWTVGSLSRLCHADFLTYFETHGWRGVMQGDEDPALPRLFPGRKGEIYPVYHVLKSMLSFYPEHWYDLQIARPLELAGILLEKPGRRRLLLANLLPRPQGVGLKLNAEASLTLLDANALEQASRDAEFWINAKSAIVRQDGRIDLGDYAIAQLDWSVA